MTYLNLYYDNSQSEKVLMLSISNKSDIFEYIYDYLHPNEDEYEELTMNDIEALMSNVNEEISDNKELLNLRKSYLNEPNIYDIIEDIKNLERLIEIRGVLKLLYNCINFYRSETIYIKSV